MDGSTQVALEALGERHIDLVVQASADWVGLAESGPPYWRPRSEAEVRRKVQSMPGPALASEYNFVVVREGQPVGEASVHGIDYRNRVGQVGVCIWDPAVRRQGLGSAAVLEVVRWSTEYLGLRRLEAWIVADNFASVTMVKRKGFVREGTLRARYLAAGRWHDVSVYALLATIEIPR